MTHRLTLNPRGLDRAAVGRTGAAARRWVACASAGRAAARAGRLKAALLCCALGGGCATQSFQPKFAPPAAPKPSVVISDLVAVKPRTERAVAVGVTSDPMRLFAWDFRKGLLWEKAVTAKSVPLVAADSVVLQESEGIVVRALATGAVRDVVDEDATLLGADGQGQQVVVSYAYGHTNQPGGVALLEAGHVRWKQALGLPVGVPALVGPYVVVPWATQRVSVLATSDGRELGRYHYRSSVMGRAIVSDGRLYLGQLGWFPADRALFEQPGARRTPYTPFKRELPGQPALVADGYVPVPDPDNAQNRLQLTWRVRSDGSTPGAENDLLLLRFYRLLFGLDARADDIRWVRSFDHDLVGAAVEPGGLWVADSAGKLSFLDVDGKTRFERDLGRGLRVLALRPAGYAPPKDAELQPSASQDKAAPDPGLRAQLFAAAALDDDRLSAARAYAATYLARSPEPQATSDLVSLCTLSAAPEPVRLAACGRLAERTNGEAAVLQALRVRASYIEGRAAPPVGALAQAAAKMQLKRAGPLLVSHLEDPNTPARDLAPLLSALEGLAEPGAVASIERFVRLHHDEPEGSELSAALEAGLHALGTLRGRAQRSTLQDIAADGFASKAVRQQAKAALAALDAPPPKSAPPAPKGSARNKAPSDEVQADPRPYALTGEVIKKALSPLRQRLGRCLDADPSHPPSGRTSLVIDGEGRIEGVFVLPASLQSCVEPILRQAHFPSTRAGRQRVTHVFYANDRH